MEDGVGIPEPPEDEPPSIRTLSESMELSRFTRSTDLGGLPKSVGEKVLASGLCRRASVIKLGDDFTVRKLERRRRRRNTSFPEGVELSEVMTAGAERPAVEVEGRSKAEDDEGSTVRRRDGLTDIADPFSRALTSLR